MTSPVLPYRGKAGRVRLMRFVRGLTTLRSLFRPRDVLDLLRLFSPVLDRCLGLFALQFVETF